MRGTLLLCPLVLACGTLFAQTPPKIFRIPADSTLLTGCDSNELIIENHTQNVPGFLFNTGRGRTIFRRGAQKLNDTTYLIGADTLKTSSARAWVQGGNAFGATGVLGTLDNNHLDLYTNDSLRARITKAGNLIVGDTTADDGSKLQVSGTLSLSPTISDGAGGYTYMSMNNNSFIGGIGHNMVFRIPDPIYNYYFQFAPRPNTGTSPKTLSFNGGGSNPNIAILSPSNYIDIYNLQNISTDASGIYLTSGGYSGMDGLVVQRNARSMLMTDPLFTVRESTDTTVFQALKNGNVGVGTKAPTAQLHTTGSVRFSGLTSNNTQARVLVSDTSGNLYYRDASTLAASDPIRSFLAVDGPIKAKELTLTAKDWPDYVFDSSYALPALAGVEDYIRQYHHLPDLPSAGEVEKTGTNVGATQQALLKKIEELTLYILQQDKAMKAMNEKMELILTKLKEK